MNSCARSHSTPPKCCILCDAYRALLNEICKSSEFLRWFCVFGIETEKLGLEVGNGLPSWKFNDQLFPCDVCGKVFGRQQTLSRHLSLHTGKAGLTWGCCSTGNSMGFVLGGRKMVRRGVCEPSLAHPEQSQAQEQDTMSEWT